ncbi:MAG: shikimate kinase [Clostridia bacterium]|nr:shikimate kinase [Clostridia bacterium]
MEKEIFGLIGRKLGHSDSAIIHEKFGLKNYRLFEIEPDEIERFLNTPNLKGLNVTIPYKMDVIPFMDEITEEAGAVGSVNTIVFRNGRKIGHNTDVYGLYYMAKRAGIDFTNKKAVVFGSGGASRAVVYAAKKMGAREIVVVSRTGENNYENLFLHEDADLLINATPVGMYPNPEGAVVDPARFKKAFGCMDLVYNPRLTDFLRLAKEAGKIHVNGLGMLVAQAKQAEEWFLDKKIDDSEIDRVLSEVAKARTSIALVGMPGAGKSSVGYALGQISGLPVYDADAEVEKEAGMTIPEIMEKEGVPAFREREANVIKRLSLLRGAIIVTGGGAVLREDNRLNLRRNARVYQIARDVSLLSKEGRPLSKNLIQMEKDRAPFYALARDVLIQNDTDIENAANAVWSDFYENTRD